MAFLRRLLGVRDPQADPRWFDIPAEGSFEVAGVFHHKAELAAVIAPVQGEPEARAVRAVLRRDPTNEFDQNAVEVRIDGALVGYVPRGSARAWSGWLQRLEQEGLAARASARVWVGDDAWFVTVLARPDASYRTPDEQAAEERRLASVKDDRVRKEANRAALEQTAVLAADRRRAGVCATCGDPIARPAGQRGQPEIQCADCRQQGLRVPRVPKPSRPQIAKPSEAAPTPPRPAVPWSRSAQPAEWAAIDLETTGFTPRFDRVVEIAIIRLSSDGSEVDAWTTLVDPERDMSAARFHGLSAADVRGAPTFAEIVPEVLGRISGARLVAHNARFDLNFLTAEVGRVGLVWEGHSAFCTMSVPYRLGFITSRRLASCCAELDIPLPDERSAAGNARASARILAATLARNPGLSLFEAASVAPGWDRPSIPSRQRRRGDRPPARLDTALGSLVDRVAVPKVGGVSQEGTLSYLDLLDRVLEDRHVSDVEVGALATIAEDWSFPAEAVVALHASYLRGMWDLALADDVITDAEREDLQILSELLGVSLDQASTAPQVTLERREDFAGKSVCFTGDSVCTIGGAFLDRDEQEELATKAGMVVKAGVSRKLDVLVLAEPDSKSGKARKADELGIRKMAEPAFWRALGVGID